MPRKKFVEGNVSREDAVSRRANYNFYRMRQEEKYGRPIPQGDRERHVPRKMDPRDYDPSRTITPRPERKDFDFEDWKGGFVRRHGSFRTAEILGDVWDPSGEKRREAARRFQDALPEFFFEPVFGYSAERQRDPVILFPEDNGMIKTRICDAGPPDPSSPYNLNMTHYDVYNTLLPSTVCGLELQALAPAQTVGSLEGVSGTGVAGTAITVIWQNQHLGNPLRGRNERAIGYEFPSTVDVTWRTPTPDVWTTGEPNPNVLRVRPAQASQPISTPQASPEASPAPATRTKTFDASGFPPTVTPAPAIPRAPGPRTKERKPWMTRALAKAMDAASETAEVIDAFYKSLPSDVRKKWSCNRASFGIDVAGQYGIDNADCKLQALWYNWEKVDFREAVKGWVMNHYSDKVRGLYERTTPVNKSASMAEGEKAFQKWINNNLEKIVSFIFDPPVFIGG